MLASVLHSVYDNSYNIGCKAERQQLKSVANRRKNEKLQSAQNFLDLGCYFCYNRRCQLTGKLLYYLIWRWGI